MNTHDNQDSRLDELLAARPVRAGDAFADRTLARLAAYEAEADARLDALLSSDAVKAGDDFTEKTLARLAAEPADEKLDGLLAAPVVEASPEFTPATLERVRRDSAPTHRQRWLASVAGLAAAVAIAFVATLPPGQPGETAIQPGPVGPVAELPATLPVSASEAATHKALVLANGLSGAAGLLDGETMELLDLLSDHSGI